MTPTRLPVIVLLFCLNLVAGFAQDTRGSLVPGTPVTLADGTSTPVQDLAVGTLVLTLGPDGKTLPGKVLGLRRQHSDSYLLAQVGGLELEATGSHRVALADGKLVRFDTVKVGDKVRLWGPKGVAVGSVASLRLYPANLVSYDLTVEGHRPFIAGGLVVGD